MALGLAGAFALRGAMTSFLAGVDELEPGTLFAVVAALLAAAAVACYLPARRATAVAPIVTVRGG